MSYYYSSQRPPPPPRRTDSTPENRQGQHVFGRTHTLGSQHHVEARGYTPGPQRYEEVAEEDDLFAEDEADHVYNLDVRHHRGREIRRFATPITPTWPGGRSSSPRHRERHVSQQYARQPLRELREPPNLTMPAHDRMQSRMDEQYDRRTSYPSQHYGSDAATPSRRYHEVIGENETFDPRDQVTEPRFPSDRRPSNHDHQFVNEPVFQSADPTLMTTRFRPAYLPIDQPDVRPRRSQVVRGIELISPHALPDRLRSIFGFPNFNAIQSKCFDAVFRKNENFVLSSPTGSGKTVIFELAICRLLSIMPHGQFKVVYQAPTKSLCAERYKDWKQKFSHFDMTCAELTGDSSLSDLKQVSTAAIIVTTPEKWDSMTRKWRDQSKLMKLVKLFLIDEVHMLKEDRGATLEAVVSRMKSMETEVRFVALSATVPNLEDVAEWLGKNSLNPHVPATREQFGEDFRPVQLERHVLGYPKTNNPFMLDQTMNKKITGIIAKHSKRKPIMVFCITRKSAVGTAQALANWWAAKPLTDRCWAPPHKLVRATDSSLKECVNAAVAFHHAGLSLEDREAVEGGYKDGNINVICCTSTLAVGVNLPCHFVIIKGTQTFHGEYSDLDLLQMLGRAGRPQYDSSAVAVIMTSNEKVRAYEQMISGQEDLESCLHTNLIDHLNAEICLETVTDLQSAKIWLQGTFFHVRLKRNAGHYLLNSHESFDGSYDEYLEHVLRKDIALLQDADLITPERRLSATKFGQAAARYYIQFETARTLLDIEPRAKLSEILSAVCQASEFDGIRFKSGDKPAYKELNQSTQMRFPIKGTLDLPACKVSIIVQSHLGGIDFPTAQNGRQQYAMDSMVVFNTINRLIKCYIDFQNETEDSIAMRNALMLSRSLSAKCWDDSPLQLRQIEGIGSASVRKLVSGDVKSLEELDACNASKVEALLNKNPPYGMKLLELVRQFPRLRLSLQTQGQPVWKAQQGARINVVATIGFLNDKIPRFYGKKPVYVVFVAETSDGKKVFFARSSALKIGSGWDIRFDVNLINPLQEIRCYIMCDDFAGTLRSAMLKPTVPSAAWPRDVVGLPNFQPTSKTRKKPSMNTSAKRNSSIPPAEVRGPPQSDYLDGIADEDIAGADVRTTDSRAFHDIDEVFDQPRTQVRKKPVIKKPPVAKGDDKDEEQPIRLPNGNWACRHPCKDKMRCSHECCKTGLDHRPKIPKKRKLPEDYTEGKTQSGPQVKNSKTQSQSQPGSGQLKGQTKLSLTAAKPKQRSDAIATVDLSAAKPRSVPTNAQKVQRIDKAMRTSDARSKRPLPSIEQASVPMSKPCKPGHRIEDVHQETSFEVQANLTDEYWGDWPEDMPLEDLDVDIDDQLGFGAAPRDASQEVDSLLDDVLVGLADSQYLQTSYDDSRDAQDDTAEEERAPAPDIAPLALFMRPEAEQATLDDNSQEFIPTGKLRRPVQAETDAMIRSNIAPDTGHNAKVPKSTSHTNKPDKAPSIAQMFAQDSSSSLHEAVAGPASQNYHGPEVHHLAAADSNKAAQEPQDSEITEPQVASAVETPQISAWLIAEFGKYVDFV